MNHQQNKSIQVIEAEKYFRLNSRLIKVIDKVTFTVRKGQCLALLGPSGCGKSTLLSMIAGFFPADGGRIEVDGKLGLCLQEDKLLPWRDLLDNICLPGEIQGKEQLAIMRQQAMEYLPVFGLQGFEHSFPAQLSGGMKQRAALLRTLLAGGDMMLLDEPFAKLDALTKEDLQDTLAQVMERFAPGILLITHDIDEALKLADEICLLTPRPAAIAAIMTTPKGAGRTADPQELAAAKKEIREILGRARERYQEQS